MCKSCDGLVPPPLALTDVGRHEVVETVQSDGGEAGRIRLEAGFVIQYTVNPTAFPSFHLSKTILDLYTQ